MMNKLVTMALIGLITTACQQTQKQEEIPEADPNAISCEGIGPVKLDYSYAALDSAIGASNLENGTAELEGQTVQVTRVFRSLPNCRRAAGGLDAE